MAPGVTLKTPQGSKVGASHPLDPQHKSTADWNAYITATSTATANGSPDVSGSTLRLKGTKGPVDPTSIASQKAVAATDEQSTAGHGMISAGNAAEASMEEAQHSKAKISGLGESSLRRATGDVPQWAEAGKLKPPVATTPERQSSLDPGASLAAASGWGSPNVGSYQPPNAEYACKPSMRQLKAAGVRRKCLFCSLYLRDTLPHDAQAWMC
jgi:hypothetical protein